MTNKNLLFRIRNKLFLNYKASPYFSQDGQDKFIHEKFFVNKRDGIFLDIGANDGITFSNTYFFEKQMGWKGICVEPNPDIFKELVKVRDATCLNAAISNQIGSATFLKIDGPNMLSGLVDFYHEDHLRWVQDELKQHGYKREEIQVQCYKINELLDSHGIKKVDYMSIDTEGGEFNIIETIDFKKISIDVISIENPYNDKRIKSLLVNNGYKLKNVVGWDEIYHKPY
jgi:FkbM family methyltransferase